MFKPQILEENKLISNEWVPSTCKLKQYYYSTSSFYFIYHYKILETFIFIFVSWKVGMYEYYSTTVVCFVILFKVPEKLKCCLLYFTKALKFIQYWHFLVTTLQMQLLCSKCDCFWTQINRIGQIPVPLQIISMNYLLILSYLTCVKNYPLILRSMIFGLVTVLSCQLCLRKIYTTKFLAHFVH